MNGSPHPSEISLSCLQAVTGGPWRAGRWLKQESRGPHAAPTWGLVSHVLVCGSSGAPPAPGSSRNSWEVWILDMPMSSWRKRRRRRRGKEKKDTEKEVWKEGIT
ncbi:unnamed protein product [Rangifer tarandus platyrhynchus]|uniref:Uncharacterized protein n=1 Tax=Rangifer tarandus platyrhynchus TaxID=3082113 RepID=A0AC59YY70_RANTA